jgi:hypothetical protein
MLQICIERRRASDKIERIKNQQGILQFRKIEGINHWLKGL